MSRVDRSARDSFNLLKPTAVVWACLVATGASGAKPIEETQPPTPRPPPTIEAERAPSGGEATSVIAPDAAPALNPWTEDPPPDNIPQTPSYALEKITITGNHRTLPGVILRYVDLRPGEYFTADDPRLEQARYRLLSLGLFHDVSLSLRRGSERGHAILSIAVKERNTIVIQDMVLGFSDIPDIMPFYGSLDIAERSFLGSGINLSAAGVFSEEQYGYRLRFADDHFLNSKYRLHIEGVFAKAVDYFGHEKDVYKKMYYDRAGIHFGTGYTLIGDLFFTVNYRYEVIKADVPPAGSYQQGSEIRPIEFGLLPGHSLLSTLSVGMVRDTRDNLWLASRGNRIALEIELSNKIIGSRYDFSKFVFTYDKYFHLGRQHALRLGFFAGLIMGESPFFNQFFVGDFSAFIPSRVLELNFDYLRSSVLDTTVETMRYEDMAGSINLEYSIPLYRGHGPLYGINGFFGLGVFALASKEDLSTDPVGYEGFQVVPMDLTVDLGVKVDTEIGIFVFSLANLFRLIPGVGRETAE